MVRLARAMGVFGEFIVGAEVVAGQPLGEDKRFQRRLPQDLAREAQARDRTGAIIRIVPVVRINQRTGFRLPQPGAVSHRQRAHRISRGAVA